METFLDFKVSIGIYVLLTNPFEKVAVLSGSSSFFSSSLQVAVAGLIKLSLAATK